MDNIFRLILLLALVLPGTTIAASVSMRPPAGVSSAASGGYQAGKGASFSGTNAYSYNAGLTAQVGGQAVTVPAAWSFAANAGQYAITGMRMSPAGLIGGALMAWALAQGLKWLDGKWVKDDGTTCTENCRLWATGAGYAILEPATAMPTKAGACNKGAQLAGTRYAGTIAGSVSGGNCLLSYNGEPWASHPIVDFGPTEPQPLPAATDADWQKMAASAAPLAALNEALANGINLPLAPPQVDTTPQYVPLSEPYVDPSTGNLTQDVAQVRPQSDGRTATVEMLKQEVNPDGTPKKETDPATGEEVDKKPEAETDPCKQNPDSSACKPLDEVPDTDLEKKENPFSINLVGGFGADNAQCPAPKTLFNKGGQPIVWEWTSYCDFARGLRPFIIGFAWISAIAMVVVVGRRN